MELVTLLKFKQIFGTVHHLGLHGEISELFPFLQCPHNSIIIICLCVSHLWSSNILKSSGRSYYFELWQTGISIYFDKPRAG